ncbi:MAG: hypothetical protein Q9217_000887, partial [Psora testacea]
MLMKRSLPLWKCDLDVDSLLISYKTYACQTGGLSALFVTGEIESLGHQALTNGYNKPVGAQYSIERGDDRANGDIAQLIRRFENIIHYSPDGKNDLTVAAVSAYQMGVESAAL